MLGAWKVTILWKWESKETAYIKTQVPIPILFLSVKIMLLTKSSVLYFVARVERNR